MKSPRSITLFVTFCLSLVVLLTQVFNTPIFKNFLAAVGDPYFLPNTVGYWPFDYDANDAYGGHNGMIVGTPTLSPGKIGQSYYFDGTEQRNDDVINIENSVFPNGETLGTNDNFSLSLWINSDADDSLGMPIHVSPLYDGGSPTPPSQFMSGFYNHFYPEQCNGVVGGIGLVLMTTDGCSDYICTNGPVSDNEWHHLVETHEGTTFSFYLDGVLQGSKATSCFSPNPAYGGISIGAQTARGWDSLWGPVNFFHGYIDDVAITGDIFTAAEVESIYNGGLQGAGYSGVTYVPPVCGDSLVDFGEQCDDGNTASGDGCSITCQTEVCVPTDGGLVCGGDDMDGDSYAVTDGDCDDNNVNVNPGALEVCDGIDNNCDGNVDEGLSCGGTSGGDLGAIGDTCASGADCASGYCDPNTAYGAICSNGALSDGCDSGDDCASGHCNTYNGVCSNGITGVDECGSNSDCVSGSCDSSTSICAAVQAFGIFECGEITSPGTYTIQNDLTTTSGCIVISADDVVLEGAGHSIAGDDGSTWQETGVFFQGRNNIVIKNLVLSDFSSGITDNGSSNHITLSDITISSCTGTGLLLYQTTNSVFFDLNIHDNGGDVYLMDGYDNSFNGDIGSFVGDGAGANINNGLTFESQTGADSWIYYIDGLGIIGAPCSADSDCQSEYCNPSTSTCALTPTCSDLDGDGYTNCAGDCNDNDVFIGPGTSEVCNGVDDNCDGNIDEGVDVDMDGYSGCGGDDCNDDDSNINPGITEVCDDGVDNNCDGNVDSIDPICAPTCSDLDGDGYMDASCGGDDCDDNNPSAYPGAEEICDGIDNNCDGNVDEGLFCGDADGDGYIDINFGGDDCDDTNWEVSPGATELCDDGLDNNCDGQENEGCEGVCDTDGDGYLDQNNFFCGIFGSTDDCDDNNMDVNPAATEICGDGVDNNCDGNVDEGCLRGYGESCSVNDDCLSGLCNTYNATCTNGDIGDYCGDGTQCNSGYCDSNSATCSNGAFGDSCGIDSDCASALCDWNTFTCITACSDVDGDGYMDASCGGDDCDDNNMDVNPGASEVCDGIDNDCVPENMDGSAELWYLSSTDCGYDLCANTGQWICESGQQIDTCTPAPTVHVYHDVDGDGFGDFTNSQDVCVLSAGDTLIAGDCTDNDASINPDATDICSINKTVVNKDCNPFNDDELNCEEYCGDIDADNYVTPERWGEWNGIIPSLVCPWVVDNGDCNDNESSVSPISLEICDGKDNNCNGIIDDNILDSDGDGVSDCQDKCSGTLADVMNLGPNNYGDIDGDGIFEWNSGSAKTPKIVDSSVTLEDTYGCSCSQIIALKPGKDSGEMKFGCTGGSNGLGLQGTMKLWISKQGWGAIK